MNSLQFLSESGVRRGHNVIVHASYKKLLQIIPDIIPENFFGELVSLVGSKGSVIFPAFTYSLKKKNSTTVPFNRKSSPAVTGYLSERFRNYEGVVRTSSPTHSFSLSGKIKEVFASIDNPVSPLGREGVMGWLDRQDESYTLLIGVNFNSLTYLHYLEAFYSTPYLNVFCWEDDYLPYGVSIEGDFSLEHIPGCSNGFENLEKHLLAENQITQMVFRDVNVYYLRLSTLKLNTESFFKNHYRALLCSNSYCKCCKRRNEYLSKEGL